VLDLVKRVHTEAAPALDARGHTAVDLIVRTHDGRSFESSLDIAPGFPGNDLTDAQHEARFADCMAYAAFAPGQERAARLREAIEGIQALPDVGALLSDLAWRHAGLGKP
jgi:hypothetical protein